jgi:bifunctional non-homologous end joining protein LigD
MNAVMNENITLYYREGSSDKVYQCGIEPSGDLFVVNFAYGRRGSTLNTGTKTSSPVKYETAKGTFDKLVREKMAKGYTPGENGTPYQHTERENRSTTILPQLLNPIDEVAVSRLMGDDNWCLQEKKDGKRMLLQKEGTTIHGINRKGLLVGLPSSLVASAQQIEGDFLIDGECVGEVLFAFDLLKRDGEDVSRDPYHSRLNGLTDLLDHSDHPQIELIETAYEAGEKLKFLQTFQKDKREGVVFKRLNAPYIAGRPSSGGSQLKHKFYATLSAVVSKINAQRSVEIRLLNGEGWVSAGNVTIPPNHPVPKVGWVVEVRYLYALRESGSLYQPVFLGSRKDVGLHECVCSQLKFKPTEDDES